MVTGTIGLMIANNPTLKGDPAAIRNRLLCNADTESALSGSIAGGRVLNTFSAITNALECQ